MPDQAPAALTLSVLSEADAAASEALKAGLYAFNDQHCPPPDYKPLIVVGRNAAGTVCVGLDGVTIFRWLVIHILWVAEAEAIARNCVGIYLVTYSYQAPEFYQKHGFTQSGRIEGFPAGHDQMWFSKMLAS